MKRILPPTWFLLALVAMVPLHLLWPVGRLWSSPSNLSGLVPLAFGVFLNAKADRQFKDHRTTVKPFERSTALVTGFPFSFTRNPMYLGMTLILAGTAVLFGTVTPWIPVVAFALLMDLRFIRAEEAMLAREFGEEWASYRRRVRRWL